MGLGANWRSAGCADRRPVEGRKPLELPAKRMTQVTTTAATRQEERTGESELPGLMARYQRGEAAAIEELVRRLSPPLLRFFSFSQVSMAEAEDLLQDCWLRIHRSRQTTVLPSRFCPGSSRSPGTRVLTDIDAGSAECRGRFWSPILRKTRLLCRRRGAMGQTN